MRGRGHGEGRGRLILCVIRKEREGSRIPENARGEESNRKMQIVMQLLLEGE
jgi:hypothetical protein